MNGRINTCSDFICTSFLFDNHMTCRVSKLHGLASIFILNKVGVVKMYEDSNEDEVYIDPDTYESALNNLKMLIRFKKS